MDRPFEGVRIIDCTHVLAGPFCTYQLALLGADVIRVEPIEVGDIMRHHGPDATLNAAGMGTGFLGQNANKRSIALNLKAEDGQAVFRRLAAGADVVVENFRPGVMERLNLGPEVLAADNARLIYCRLTGFGQNGPWREHPAYDHLIQGVSGIMSTTGTPTSGPTRVGFPVVDYAVGLVAAFALATALFQRERTGLGQVIDTAMLDAALVLMGPLLANVLVCGQEPQLRGNQAASGSPFSGVFETSDALLAVVANTPAQGRRLLQVLGISEWDDDPRLEQWASDAAVARDLSEAVHPVLTEVLRTGTAAAWEEALLAAHVPAGKVRTLPEVLGSEQVAARGLLHAVPAAPGIDRDIRVQGPGFRLAHGDAAVTRPPPRHGAHTSEVLEEAGYSSEELALLREQGVIAGT